MKVIFTHKSNLKTASDVRRMFRYIYEPNGEKVIGIVVGKEFPGLPTGDISLDASSLTAGHPGGRAALARNIVMSGEFMPTKEEAINHLPAVGKTLDAYIAKWLPASAALAVVHVSEGKGRYKGQWRLDAHLLAVNWDKRTDKSLQFSREQMQSMQAVEGYIPPGLDIQSGRGAGELRRPRGPLIYPYSRKIDALEVGQMSDKQLEEHIAKHKLETRRRKDGTIISVTTTTGRKTNLAKARAVARHLSGEPNNSGAGGEIRSNSTGNDRMDHHRGPGINPSHARTDRAINDDVCLPRRRREVASQAFFSRRARRQLRASLGKSGGSMDLINGYFDRSSQLPPLAVRRAPSALLSKAVDCSALLEDMHAAQIIK